MAESPSHKLGQIIGNILEGVIGPSLDAFARAQNLYLDHSDKPRKVRKGKKVTWEDGYGNMHELDYVLERGGSSTAFGFPVAFIEVAWRRYTKHSKNKAQEIQGAILPLAQKFRSSNPFLGAVLGGAFTEASLVQLRSLGFEVLYFPYATLVEAFAREKVNVRFDEATPDVEFRGSIQRIESLPRNALDRIKNHLVQSNREQIDAFMRSIARRFSRSVDKVVVVPLYGRASEFATIEGAINFLSKCTFRSEHPELTRYEVCVSFSNGDKAEASFTDRQKARDFLQFVATQ